MLVSGRADTQGLITATAASTVGCATCTVLLLPSPSAALPAPCCCCLRINCLHFGRSGSVGSCAKSLVTGSNLRTPPRHASLSWRLSSLEGDCFKRVGRRLQAQVSSILYSYSVLLLLVYTVLLLCTVTLSLYCTLTLYCYS